MSHPLVVSRSVSSFCVLVLAALAGIRTAAQVSKRTDFASLEMGGHIERVTSEYDLLDWASLNLLGKQVQDQLTRRRAAITTRRRRGTRWPVP